jgi:hypothetical protein
MEQETVAWSKISFIGGAFFQKIRMPYRPTRASEGGEDQHHLGQELKEGHPKLPAMSVHTKLRKTI